LIQRIELEWMPCELKPFQDAVADWPGTTAGLYWLLLMRQWVTGYVPSGVVQCSRLLRLSVEELKPHWELLSSKFTSEGDRMVNARLEVVYERQAASYLSCVLNGRKGGRPTHKKTQPEPTPKPIKKRESSKKISVAKATGDDDPSPPGSETRTLEGMDLTKPFGQSYAVLFKLAEMAGSKPPPYSDAQKHVSGHTGLLKLARELGVEEAATLIFWIWEHKANGAPFSVIYDNRDLWSKQMREGVRFVDRAPALSGASPKGLAADLDDNPFRQ
jgi:uncharacterized protein YdaU (DUF1376 family)